LNVLAHFYNENQKWNAGTLQAVATIKLDWTPNIAIQNFKYEYPEAIQPYPWQQDKTMGADWYWIRNATARDPPVRQVLHMLLDTVSKNGNLLLNVPLTPEGELEPETVNFLSEMGRCLEIIGEAVFATRCWEIADEGDALRFTRNKENTIRYITSLAWPEEELWVKILNSSHIELNSLKSVLLVGAGKLAYNQNAEALTIKVPAQAPYDSPAYPFKLEFAGPIPSLKSVDLSK
jgi:alpha-L-fucosidase